MHMIKRGTFAAVSIPGGTEIMVMGPTLDGGTCNSWLPCWEGCDTDKSDAFVSCAGH